MTCFVGELCIMSSTIADDIGYRAEVLDPPMMLLSRQDTNLAYDIYSRERAFFTCLVPGRNGGMEWKDTGFYVVPNLEALASSSLLVPANFWTDSDGQN